MSSTPGSERSPVEDHIQRIATLIGELRPRDAESVPLDEALHRRLRHPVRSSIPLPPFRNSQMDGFAVRTVDVVPGRQLAVVGVIAAAAGAVPPLRSGTSVRIMTGAPIPQGADAVIPVEDATVLTSGDGETLSVTASVPAGAFIREAGSDLPADGLLLDAGVVLASRHIAALAAAGIATIEVQRRIRIAIMSTGSELAVASAGTTLQPGQIFDANGPALAAAARAAGADVVLRTSTSDAASDFERALDAAAAVADVVVTAGGISQGDFEVVREVLEPHGAWVGSLALQPGGPQALARFHGIPVLCFPGNPVSAQLSFELFLAPLLRSAAGLPPRVTELRTLTVDLTSVPERVQLVRARALESQRIEPVSGPGSHLVATMAAADRIIVVPAETTRLTAGSEVTTWVL